MVYKLRKKIKHLRWVILLPWFTAVESLCMVWWLINTEMSDRYLIVFVFSLVHWRCFAANPKSHRQLKTNHPRWDVSVKPVSFVSYTKLSYSLCKVHCKSALYCSLKLMSVCLAYWCGRGGALCKLYPASQFHLQLLSWTLQCLIGTTHTHFSWWNRIPEEHWDLRGQRHVRG